MNNGNDLTTDATSGERLASSEILPVSTLINGRYRILELLGKGGMGVVYRVTDTVNGCDVALKVLRGERLNTSSLALFKAEFLTLGTLHHPNIATVYDFAQRQGSADFFFTMELVPGKNALDATECASFEEVLAVALQVLRALAYLHTREVIHLDLKPANILVTPDGGVRLLDFGIARSAHCQTHGPYATPLYMAPEMLRDGAEIDRRADLYSFGVTLFQLLFRRVPADGSLLDFSHPLEGGRFTLSVDERTHVPEWIPGVLRRLVARDPAQRFRTANEVIAAINEARGGNDEIETDETRDSYVASTTLVGQDDALEALLACLEERAHSGRDGPIVALCVGPSGSGKSRLLREVRQQCQLSRHFFFEAQCYGEGGEPYSAWSPIVSQAASLIPAAVSAHHAVICRLAITP